jgi:ribose transport system substrate-binding protein
MDPKKLFFVFMLLVAVIFSTFAGGQAEEAGSGTAETAAPLDETYVLIAPHIGIQYWQVHKAGLEAAAEKLGVKTIFTGVMGDSVEDQAKILEQQIAKKPAGILVGPLNAAGMTPSINRAMKAGIPVITVDTDAAGSDRLCYIGTNGYAAGEMAADRMARLLNKKGAVGISNLVGFATCEERAAGFRDRIETAYPNMEVVAEVDDKADVEHATKVVMEMLVANPEIKGIFGVDAVSPLGMGAAVKNLDKVGEVQLIGFDPMPQTLKLIEDGVVESTMVQRTFAMSFIGLELLYAYNRGWLELVKGWDVPAAQEAGINTLPNYVDTGIMVVDKTNYKFFEEK